MTRASLGVTRTGKSILDGPFTFREWMELHAAWTRGDHVDAEHAFANARGALQPPHKGGSRRDWYMRRYFEKMIDAHSWGKGSKVSGWEGIPEVMDAVEPAEVKAGAKSPLSAAARAWKDAEAQETARENPKVPLTDEELLAKLRKGSGLKTLANAQRAFALVGATMTALPKPRKGFVVETPEHGTLTVEVAGYKKIPDYAYSYAMRLHVPKEQEAAARAFSEWLKTAASAKLGRQTVEEERGPDGEARARDYKTDFTIRTCPVCFRDIKATKGVMADHGYRVQWHSRQGKCPGVREKPWEVSTEGAQKFLARMIEHYESLRRSYDTIGTDGRSFFVENSRDKKMVEILPNDDRYPRVVEDRKNKIASELRMLYGGRFGGIPWYRMAIREWRPGRVDAPAVGAPRRDVSPVDSEGLTPPPETKRYNPARSNMKRAAPVEVLPFATLNEHGHRFETGVPVTFTYLRNLVAAPKRSRDGEDRFQQKIEPAGRYMAAVADDTKHPDWGEFSLGTITFNKPLVLADNTGAAGRYDEQSWKAHLSRAYKGKKGKALSAAIARDGYDGIVTIGKYGTGEIVDLRFLHTGVIERANPKSAAIDIADIAQTVEAAAMHNATDTTRDVNAPEWLTIYKATAEMICDGLSGSGFRDYAPRQLTDAEASRVLARVLASHTRANPKRSNMMRSNPGPDDPATSRFYVRGRDGKMHAVWEIDARAYQAMKGVHAPWIAEISPMQYGGLSGRERKRYDEKRDREWQASADIKNEWRDLVVEAGQLGLFDPSRASESASSEAKSTHWSGVVAKKEEALSVARGDARVQNMDVSSLAKGDIVFSVMASGYVVITKVSAKSARGDRVGAINEHGRDMKLQRGALEWLSYNDLSAAVEQGAGTTAELKAIAQTKGSKSNPYGSHRGVRYYATAGTYRIVGDDGPPFRHIQDMREAINRMIDLGGGAMAAKNPRARNPFDASDFFEPVPDAPMTPDREAFLQWAALKHEDHFHVGKKQFEVRGHRYEERGLWALMSGRKNHVWVYWEDSHANRVKVYPKDKEHPTQPDTSRALLEGVVTFETTRSNPAPDGHLDRSTHPNVVQYAMQSVVGGMAPGAAAKRTAKRLSGSPNMMLSAPADPVYIDPKVLEAAVWREMEAQARKWAGKDGVEGGVLSIASMWNQSPKTLDVLRKRLGLGAKKNVGMLHAPYEQRRHAHLQIEDGPPPRRPSYADAMAGVRRAADAAVREEIEVSGSSSGQFGLGWKAMPAEHTERLDMKAISNPWAHEMADAAWPSWKVIGGPHSGFEFPARDEASALRYVRERGLGTRVQSARMLTHLSNPRKPKDPREELMAIMEEYEQRQGKMGRGYTKSWLANQKKVEALKARFTELTAQLGMDERDAWNLSRDHERAKGDTRRADHERLVAEAAEHERIADAYHAKDQRHSLYYEGHQIYRDVAASHDALAHVLKEVHGSVYNNYAYNARAAKQVEQMRMKIAEAEARVGPAEASVAALKAKFAARDAKENPSTGSTDWNLTVWDEALNNSKSLYDFHGTEEAARQRAQQIADDWHEPGHPVKVMAFDATRSDRGRSAEAPDFTVRGSHARIKATTRKLRYQQAVADRNWDLASKLTKRKNTALAKAPKTRAVKHAADWYTKSHWGIKPEKAIHIDDPDLPAAMTQMGTLHELEVKDGRERFTLDFTKYSPKCHVSFDPGKSRRWYLNLSSSAEADCARRLWVADGKTYTLSEVAAMTKGRHSTKRYRYPDVEGQVLGKLVRIDYHSDKKETAQSKGQGGNSIYTHKVGEEDGKHPYLMIDASGRLWVVGGNSNTIAGGLKN